MRPSIRTYRFIISLAIAGLAGSGLQAQSLVWPSAVRVGTDLSRIGISAISPVRKQYEINADVDLYKYFITCDFGNWTTNLSENDFDYSMSGWYLRSGFDYNFLFSDKDNQVMFFGLRYCTSVFNETFGYRMVDPYYGPFTDTFSKSGSKANWVEMNTGMKVHIWKGLYLGWNPGSADEVSRGRAGPGRVPRDLQ